MKTVPFNTYVGPEKPELLLITCSACTLYSREAIQLLGLKDRVGLLKMGTTWPLPPKLLKKYLSLTDKILFVEEVLPFLEENVKIIAAEQAKEIGAKTFYGKNSGRHSHDRRDESGFCRLRPGQNHGDRLSGHVQGV